jgi:hypothetical protein
MKEFKLSFIFYLKSLKEKPTSFVIFLFFNIISVVYLFNGRIMDAIRTFFILFPFMVLAMSIDIVNSEYNNMFIENILFLKKIKIEKYFLYKNFFPFLISLPAFLLILFLGVIINYPLNIDIPSYIFLALYYSFLGTLVSYKSKGISNFLIVFVSVLLYLGYIGFSMGFDNFQFLKGIKKIIVHFFLILSYPVFINKQTFFIIFYMVFCIIIYYCQVIIWKKKKR